MLTGVGKLGSKDIPTRDKKNPPEWFKGYWDKTQKKAHWAHNATREVEFTILQCPLTPYSKILDLGCGTGRHSLEFAKKGHRVVGIDINNDLIAMARKSAIQLGLDNVSFINECAFDIQFFEEFDLVTNFYDGAIGYFPTKQDNLEFFEKIFKSIKPGGYHFTNIWRKSFFHGALPEKSWRLEGDTLTLTSYCWDNISERLTHGGAIVSVDTVLNLFSNLKKYSCYQLYDLDDLRNIYTANELVITSVHNSFLAESIGTDISKPDIIISAKKFPGQQAAVG